MEHSLSNGMSTRDLFFNGEVILLVSAVNDILIATETLFGTWTKPSLNSKCEGQGEVRWCLATL